MAKDTVKAGHVWIDYPTSARQKIKIVGPRTEDDLEAVRWEFRSEPPGFIVHGSDGMTTIYAWPEIRKITIEPIKTEVKRE